MKLAKPITLKWWQVSIFKLSMISFGVFVGSYWPDVFTQWTSVLLVVFAVTALYLLSLWWKNGRD